MLQWLQRLFSGSAEPPAASAAAVSKPAASFDAPDTVPTPVTPAQTQASSGISAAQRRLVDSGYYAWLFDTPPAAPHEVSALETQMLEALDAVLKSPKPGADMIGRLPGVIPQLLQSLRSENFSGAQLARTIESDVVLVAALIRLANSSAISPGKPITSIEHAVILIGQKGLRHLITSIAFHPIIDPHSGPCTRKLSPRILEQSERCAQLNRMLAEEMDVGPFDAFLAGLVQYTGLTAALRVMDKVARDQEAFGSSLFCTRLLQGARQLTLSIAEELDFPPAVTAAIAEQEHAQVLSTMSPLGHLLALGDYLAKLQMLVASGRLTDDDTRVFAGLSPQELACYRQPLKTGGHP